MPRNRRLGADAEDRAAAFVHELGYTLVTRNYHAKTAEIDMVAMDDDTLVFIEVRERQEKGWRVLKSRFRSRSSNAIWQAAEHYMANVMEREVDGQIRRHRHPRQ